jgi:ABC-type molybdate transport system substrate-binding protein
MRPSLTRTLALGFALAVSAALPMAHAATLTVLAPKELRSPLDDITVKWINTTGEPAAVSYGDDATIAGKVEQAAPGDIVILADAAALDALTKKSLIGKPQDLVGKDAARFSLARVTAGKNEMTDKFIAFLNGPDSQKLFQKYGFTAPVTK